MNKEEEFRRELSWFINDQTQLAKIFRRDVEELKRIQQEHMSKLDIHLISTSFDELIQQQINKYYHYKHSEDDEEEEDCLDDEQKLIKKFDKLHDEHVLWLKKKKKNTKITGPIIERFRMLNNRFCFYYYLYFSLEELYDHLQVIDNQ
jgi:hypothetical protein